MASQARPELPATSLVALVDVFDEKHSLLVSGVHCSIGISMGVRLGARRLVWHGLLEHPDLAEKIVDSLPGGLWLVASNWERAVIPTGPPASSHAIGFDGEGEPPPGTVRR